MPFTLSHPAAVLPFARTRLDLSALVIGSMSPDFIYFIYLNPRGEATHTLAGIFEYCLPAGLLALALYHLFLKPPLQSILSLPAYPPPTSHSDLFTLRTIRRLALVIISLLIGALTHLGWDAFTHENNWLTQFLPFLNATVFDLGFDKVPLTRILHHASTIFGGLCLIVWARRRMGRWPVENDRKPKLRLDKHMRLAGLGVCISAVAGLLYAWSQVNSIHDFDQFRQMMVQALVATGSVLFMIAFFYSIIWRMTRRRAATTARIFDSSAPDRA